VVGAEKRGAGKAGGDRGGVLLKGRGGEVAEGGGSSGEGATWCREDVGPGPDRRATPRPTAVRAGGVILSEQGSAAL
jgi:hypothetical protein